MQIGNNIKFLRQKNNLTQEQLAERLGVSYQAVSKWETNANTPDISLLPQIASLFHVSIDALFSDDIAAYPADFGEIEDDDVIRIIQMRGKQIVKVTPTLSPQDNPPIEIAFPRNCNDKTQYFKVEIFGHVIADGSINGDVVCHQSIQCAAINGDIHSEGNISAHEINANGKLICKNISNCYRLHCAAIECTGHIDSANLTCGQIIYRK